MVKNGFVSFFSEKKQKQNWRRTRLKGFQSKSATRRKIHLQTRPQTRLIHSLTHRLSHKLTLSLTHRLTQRFAHELTHRLAHRLTNSLSTIDSPTVTHRLRYRLPFRLPCQKKLKCTTTKQQNKTPSLEATSKALARSWPKNILFSHFDFFIYKLYLYTFR